MGPTPFYGARAEKTPFAKKQLCRLSGDITSQFCAPPWSVSEQWYVDGHAHTGNSTFLFTFWYLETDTLRMSFVTLITAFILSQVEYCNVALSSLPKHMPNPDFDRVGYSLSSMPLFVAKTQARHAVAEGPTLAACT